MPRFVEGKWTVAEGDSGLFPGKSLEFIQPDRCVVSGSLSVQCRELRDGLLEIELPPKWIGSTAPKRFAAVRVTAKDGGLEVAWNSQVWTYQRAE